MKLLFISLFFFGNLINTDIPNNKYFSYSSCDFAKYKKDVSELENISIIHYSVLNNKNPKKYTLAEYYLVKSSVDTFNIVMLVDKFSSDALIKEYRYSKAWNFWQMKDTCVYFKSQINLKKEINFKYPVIFGTLFLENC